MSDNRLCKALGIEKPIIQGPMAHVTTAPLVAAVSNAGGLGVLGVAFATPEIVATQIRETRKLTKKPFGVNVFMFPIPDMLDAVTAVIIKERPDVVYADTLNNLDLSLCRNYFPKWKAAGAKIIVKASRMEDAITGEKGGADVIIVKGWEGGGHVTPEATTVLVPQAADALSVPVVASGGIAEGRGMAAAIALGAAAVEMGSVFLCAEETDIPINVKQAIIKAGDMETIVTGTCTGEPCRQLENQLSDRILAIEAENPANVAAAEIKEMVGGSLRKAMVEGEIEMEGAVMVGQIIPLINKIRPASEIIDSTISQCKEVLLKLSQFDF
jgi:enoyl-[acyl-carrier protein] reductase II